MSPVTLVITSDLHSRLSDHARGRLSDVLAEHPDAVFFDGGDAARAGNISYSRGGEPALRALGELGCRALGLGNREFHVRSSIFERKVADAPFPIVCTSIYKKSADSSIFMPVPHALMDVAPGVAKVGFISIINPMVRPRSLSSAVSDYLFWEPSEMPSEPMSEFARSCDLIVCNCHTHPKRTRQMAKRFPELDLVIQSHTHEVFQEPVEIEGTPVVGPGAWAKHCCVVRFDEREQGSFALSEYQVVNLKED